MKPGTSKEYLKGTRRGRNSPRLPLDRYLKSKIGEPWSRIHSEMSAEFSKRTEAGRRFWDHLKYSLEEKCWVGSETGDIFAGTGRVDGFYVHPWTNLLGYQKRKPWPKAPEAPITRYVIDSMRAYEKLKGCWFYTEYKKNEYYAPWRINDTMSEKEKDLCRRGYTINEQSKRQLSRKELKTLNLVNDIGDSE